MSDPKLGWSDDQVEQVLGNLLRTGVILSSLVVLVGGSVYLARHANETVHYHVFDDESTEFRTPPNIVQKARAGSGRGLIMLGLLLLIATPVARVAFSVYAFVRQRDRTYILITLFVLAVLLYSLFSGTIG
jgi:uncharacterized membrane protein